jgi:hypothetical protein
MDCVDELPLCCKIEHERKYDEHVESSSRLVRSY